MNPAMQGVPLVLASASPRRRQLLAQLGLAFEVHPSEVEEPPFAGGLPADYALSLAVSKAESVAVRFGEAVVLGADTIVVVDGKVLGKPRDDDHAATMIASLAGRKHHVITAVALRGTANEGFAIKTDVWFRSLDADEVAGYVATGEGRDKAGAYGIQDVGAALVSRIDGSYSNVVGLPLAETVVALRRAGALLRWP